MRVLIIGYGSIGQRHANVAKDLGHQVALVTSQKIDGFQYFASEDAALKEFAPEAIVIANATHRHVEVHANLRNLGFKGRILVEKPVSLSAKTVQIDRDSQAFVGYNLRFHPVVQQAKAAISSQKKISAQLYVGQNLTKWSPNRDYRTSYRASREQGGGALGDLSHEIDLIQYLLGPILRLSALGGKKSSLEIATEDCFCVLFETTEGVIGTLELNYIDHNTTRFLNVVCDQVTVRGDLIKNQITINEVAESFPVDRNFTYIEQMKNFLATPSVLCKYEEGIKTVRLIEAMTESARLGQWIKI